MTATSTDGTLTAEEAAEFAARCREFLSQHAKQGQRRDMGLGVGGEVGAVGHRDPVVGAQHVGLEPDRARRAHARHRHARRPGAIVQVGVINVQHRAITSRDSFR